MFNIFFAEPYIDESVNRMCDKKVFCENCRDDVLYTEHSVPMSARLKGKNYSYEGKIALCERCGSELYVPELMDSNLEALYAVYRSENHIIQVEAVRAIPEKYAIGKRPLSLLLGWGEQTFSRYVEGDIPTRQYSEILERLYNDPAFYAELLEKNKENLKSEAAYEKSRKAVQALLPSQGKSSKRKIIQAAQYLVNQCEDITPLALQKALYYIQGFYFAFNGSFLFSENCYAWVHGPVYKDLYNLYKDYHFNPIRPVKKFDSSQFTQEEKAVYDSVIMNICCYSGKTLERFTHHETPWISARGNLPEYAPSEQIIDKNLIAEYFCSTRKKYSMSSPEDIKKYASDIFSSAL